MQEQSSGKIVINNEALDADNFRLMLKWIYTGECEVSDLAYDVIPLL